MKVDSIMFNGEKYFSGAIFSEIEEALNEIIISFDEEEKLIQYVNTHRSIDISINIPYVSEEIVAMIPNWMMLLNDGSISIDNVNYLRSYNVYEVVNKIYEILSDTQDTITNLRCVLREYQKNILLNERDQDIDENYVKRIRISQE